MKHIRIAALMALSVLSATVATRADETHYSINQKNAPQALTTQYDGRDVLVVIRYPASVAPDAMGRFNQVYDGRGFENIFYHPREEQVIIPWAGKESNSPKRDVQNAGMQAIAKTTYFALGLYEALKKVLPNGAVRLQPVVVDLKDVRTDANGAIAFGESWPHALVDRPTVAYAPAPLYLDVFAFVDPYWQKHGVTTFGVNIAPLISIRTAPAAAPLTNGSLVTMSAFMADFRTVRPDADAAHGAGVSMTDYLSAIEGVPADFSALPQSALSDKLPLQPGKVLVLPTRSMPLPADSLNDEYSPAESAIFDDYGLLVVNALNAISYDDATKAARARYIAFYDPELAHRWRTGTATTPDDMQKLQLLRRFERAEWQLLGKEDEHFETAVYHGQWGAGMRSARQGEKDFTDQETSARSQAEMSMMVGMLGSMSSMPTASMSPQMRLQSSMNMLSSDISVVAQQQETDQKLASISASFGARMRDINAEGVQFLFAVGNATMNIQARSLADLRVKMRALYRHSLVAGSMPVPVPASTSGTTTAAAAPIVTSAPATKP